MRRCIGAAETNNGKIICNAMISLKNKFLFIHIPKTAGNSIQNILRNFSEDRIVCSAPFQDGVERFGVTSERYGTRKHSTLNEYRSALENEIFSSLFKFTTVRNPWDRMISFYFSPHLGRVAWDRNRFKALLPEVPPVTAYLSMTETAGQCSFGNVDYFIRFENLEDDFSKACDRIGIPWTPLPVRNKSERRSYTSYYDDELAELVQNRFSDEIEYFGYEFKPDS